MSALANQLSEQFDFSHLTIRLLNADDGLAYRKLRQRVLEIGDGKYFSSSYERERRFITEQHWRDWCTEQKEHCTIGTFYRDQLIGIMGIIQFGNPEDQMVEWEVTWLDPQYRNYGIAKLSYEKVHNWTKEHGYLYACVYIREGNVRSRQIREAQGAIYLSTLYNQKWADGSTANVDFFIIDLYPAKATQNNPYERALRYLNETHDVIQDIEQNTTEHSELKKIKT